MQVSGLIHRDACAGHDGIDRAISFAAVAPALPLLKLLIDGLASSSLLRSGFWDEIHLLFNLPKWGPGSCRNCHFIAIQSVA